ncbi:maleylpyruvate isomerase family mycothiol-dependent enzyme [Frankia sp. AgB1.9]|uniref:maleylpyruvate isomerase family mycothiol-dependent enzyme n=1 Tax=unclassified Frankia TaxID=2632575 RepID=UPI001931B110|nr:MULTISPECIES: maleylpyruvate isomerase family mycothiol-dependent enzyme [unclassified Frankia]MBL7486897.1 maleylpyruvate isomerase family mycothiol-dependent enzyme [Frankia sp. AgW1.1]MBL7547216.1 maleylpyruvate isomerase family mycothiol-dependent enzyme [Frankia sp. AgB1.9]MBL7623992.1 maleylpyruvate isomerase family mycothiol-dependent enzyme [Frankia sp. AgB1.8]
MHADDVWQAIDTQRLRVADLLEKLTDDEWRTPSLCDGWTVRDVAAHLTLQQTGLGGALRMVARSPGGMKRVIHRSACLRAAMPTEQMIAEIRGMVGSRKHNAGVTCQETLIDILVHGLDIAIPLQKPLAVSPEAAAVAADRVWSVAFPSFGYPFFPRKRLRGLRLTASDTEWAVGEGAPVDGPMDAILLLLTGRLAALPRLSGEGTHALRARLTPAQKP